MKTKHDGDHAAKRRFFKTARIVESEHFVALVRFCPASEQYKHADFWIVRDTTGKEFSVFERELTGFCL